MTLMQRIAREPVAIAGVLVALYGLATAFEIIEFTDTQLGAITTLAGAVVFAIRWLTTPSGEVVAVQAPSDATPVAGPKATAPDGTPVTVVPA